MPSAGRLRPGDGIIVPILSKTRGNIMNNMMISALAAGAFSVSAHADEPEQGRWQIKLLATAVLPDGSITTQSGPAMGALAGADVAGSDNYVPTLAVEYFVSPALSIETICCGTMHHMDGTGALANVRLVDKVFIVPATVTAKYHFNLGRVQPYLGAGPALFIFANKEPGAALKTSSSAPAHLALSNGRSCADEPKLPCDCG